MASGVHIHSDIPAVIREIQLGSKSGPKYKYIVFRINQELTEVVVEKCATSDKTYDDFIEDMKEAESNRQCRWAVVDFSYKTRSNMDKNKLVYFSWNPDTANIKQKMVYASSNDAVKKAIGNCVGITVQAADLGDLEAEEVQKEILRLDKA